MEVRSRGTGGGDVGVIRKLSFDQARSEGPIELDRQQLDTVVRLPNGRTGGERAQSATALQDRRTEQPGACSFVISHPDSVYTDRRRASVGLLARIANGRHLYANASRNSGESREVPMVASHARAAGRLSTTRCR